jgi:hypothetical protein
MTDNQLVKSKKDIIDFKRKYKKIYGIDLYIYAKKELKKNIDIQLYIKCALECFEEEHPDLKHINKIDYKTRLRCFLVYVQTMCYLANKDGWSKNFIGRKINKNHATVVNSCRRIKDGLEVNDELVVKTYHQLINKLTEYVGTIPKNLKTKDQSESSVDTIWDEARRFIAQSSK